ncbi:hypothetical protein ACFW9F_23560 [Streptomyces sp. NPDC059506]|uniref:hypothetical protein n=1 Tax=Streptomyces sp. NPDC059506 TaxID=3347751 RepID=UPI00368347EB
MPQVHYCGVCRTRSRRLYTPAQRAAEQYGHRRQFHGGRAPDGEGFLKVPWTDWEQRPVGERRASLAVAAVLLVLLLVRLI